MNVPARAPEKVEAGGIGKGLALLGEGAALVPEIRRALGGAQRLQLPEAQVHAIPAVVLCSVLCIGEQRGGEGGLPSGWPHRGGPVPFACRDQPGMGLCAASLPDAGEEVRRDIGKAVPPPPRSAAPTPPDRTHTSAERCRRRDPARSPCFRTHSTAWHCHRLRHWRGCGPRAHTAMAVTAPRWPVSVAMITGDIFSRDLPEADRAIRRGTGELKTIRSERQNRGTAPRWRCSNDAWPMSVALAASHRRACHPPHLRRGSTHPGAWPQPCRC